MNTLSVIALVLFVGLAAVLVMRARRRERRRQRDRVHRPHTPAGGRDASAIARSVGEGHGGQR